VAKKLVSRTAKVLSETKKTKDKEAVAVAYEHIPRNPDELKHGSIYAVIELEDKGGHAEEIAERIIDVLHESFYENLEKEPLESFEASLAKINDELADRSSEGQINWLGKLNAILGIFSENTLHVTQTGKAEAYLYRGEHTMHITEDLAGDSINPQRTFINIASGDLTEKDKVALATPGVFYKISKSELKNYTQESSPKNAADNISKLLSGENGTVKPNAILIMEMISPESYAADDEATESAEAWVKEDSSAMEDVSKGVTGGAFKFFDFIGKAFGATSAFISTKALPIVKEGTQKAGHKIKKFRKVEDAENIILESEERLSAERIKEADTNLEIDTDDGILETPVDNTKEIRIKETRRKPKLLSVERFDFSFLERLKERTTSGAKGIRLPKGKNSYLYIGVAVFFIISLVAYLGYAGTIKEAKSASETKLNQANSLYEESLTELANGDYRVASSNLISAEKLATEVAGSKYLNDEARDLLTKINDKKDEASRITRNTAQLFNEFETNIDQIFTNGTLIYAVDYETGSVSSVDPKSGATAKITENPAIEGKILFSNIVTSRNTLVAYTENQEVYEINLDNGNLAKQNINGGWEEATALSSFGTNIYLLSPTDNQIYRHLKIARGYGQKADYFNTPQTLGGAIGIAIDGSLYLTDKSANVSKFTSGVREEFALQDLPIDYSDVRGIYTTPNTDGLYLYTKNLVIKIDENGKFVSQYANDGAKEIKGVFVLENKIFFLSDNNIFALNP
jgi:hypothetical protein